LNRNSSTTNIREAGIRHNKSYVSKTREKIIDDSNETNDKNGYDYNRGQQTFAPLDKSIYAQKLKGGY
jgi:hypothetical protein